MVWTTKVNQVSAITNAEHKRPRCFSNCEIRRDWGPNILGFQDFGVYEPLMHKKNETRSVELRNAKGLWAQHFGVSEFGISGFHDSRFRDSGGNFSRPFELSGPKMMKRVLMGLRLFTFRGFTIWDFETPNATFLGLRTPRTRNAEKGLNGFLALLHEINGPDSFKISQIKSSRCSNSKIACCSKP